VPDGVGEALLGDAVRRQGEARAQRDGVALDVETDVHVAGADLADQPLQLRQRRLRGEAGRLAALGAEHSEEAAHLRERLAGGGLHGGDVFGFARVLGPEPAAYCLGLDGHHADGVGHDVVQLAGDPGALLRAGACRLELGLPLDLGGASEGGLGAGGALAEQGADRPRPDEEHESRREVAGLEGVDDREDQERHDHQAEAQIAARRRGLVADGEADQHDGEQCGEVALGVDGDVGGHHDGRHEDRGAPPPGEGGHRRTGDPHVAGE
jgi:hypothetical protein